MPKSYFSQQDITSLATIPPGGRIHFIGVCGVGMGQLAVALAEQGYQVSGSDKEFYEPMGTFLRNSAVVLQEGYQSNNIPPEVDLVVIGNAISYGHPEVDVIEANQLPYTHFPQLLYETIIAGRRSIVVCGTHGKTTTTAMITTSLIKLGQYPSYFIGGIVPGVPRSLQIGKSLISIVEGDEYDSSFFAKVPKFNFYQPEICVINAIEYDHADIYPNLTAIEAVFTKLVRNLSHGSQLICSLDSPVVARLLPNWREQTTATITTFGQHPQADCRIVDLTQMGPELKLTLHHHEQSHEVILPAVGSFSARNACACLLAVEAVGFPTQAILTSLTEFRSVKRRQEILLNNPRALVIEDFAHHPTAIKETIAAVRAAYPQRRLWAIFEPRSNTTRRRVFQDEFLEAFGQADQVILGSISPRPNECIDELLDEELLVTQLTSRGIPAVVLQNATSIIDHLDSNHGTKDIYLIMSNGSFDQLPSRLVEHLRQQND